MTARTAALEERVSRLEETLFFQDRLLNDLNGAITGQQRQIDALGRTLDEMREQLEEIRQLLETGAGPVNAPPPHYLER